MCLCTCTCLCLCFFVFAHVCICVQIQQEHETELVIGSAPCTSFRTLLHPARKERKSKLRRRKAKRYNTQQRASKAYQRQLSMGRHFLHEHSVHASSWCMPEMRELLSDGRIQLVQGLVCRWRMTATDDRDEQEFVHGKRRWATSSSRLATVLAREHAGENRRVRLIGQNETIAGAMYSPRRVKEVLKALGKQLVDDGRLYSVSLYSGSHKNAKKLTPIKVKEGKRGEIEWVLKQKLFDYVPDSECAEWQGRLHSLKWALKNKGKSSEHD